MIRHVFRLIWNRKRTNFLMMTEIFVSFLVLFAVVALAVYTADNWRRPLGFSIDRVWAISVDMKQISDDHFTAAQQETTRQLMLALSEFREVEKVAGTMGAPYQFGSWNSGYEWHGRRIEFGVAEVTDGFKDVLGLEIVEGRWFTGDDDGQTYDAVIINQDMRKDLFGDGVALEKNIANDRLPDSTEVEREKRVVGVLAAYREDGEFDGERNYVLYRKTLVGTADRRNRPPRNLLIKVAPGTSLAFEERLIKRLQAVAPEWSFEVTTLASMRDTSIRFAMVPLAAVGLVAGFLMLMVALGLLGVLWQNVTQRTREMGLRRAKGAAKVDVQRQILAEIGVMTTLALLAGVLVAVQFPLLDIIYFVEPRIYAIGLAISVTAIYLLTLACAWYPSRMATRVEPAEALRYRMILIVDDDPSVTASLALLLKQAGYVSHSAASPADALTWLDTHSCELVVQDMNFSRRTTGEEGLDLLVRIKALRPGVPVVLITAWGSIQLAVLGMKAGATDFITKPWTHEQILQTVRTVLGLAASATADERLGSREELDASFDFGNLVGEDPRLLRILQMIGRVSATDASVLVTGESGTGKELVADAIHGNSQRRLAPFVKVNLGGISSSLFESEMFGHVRGAFTDARHDRKGRFETASGGTIFLDEIGDLDPGSQVKLLRVLQDRTFEVLGSSQRRTVDVRVVAATNRNLADMVSRGEFREDLLYRINLITLHLPPLRERRDDIPILASRFLQAVGQVYRREDVRISADGLAWLKNQPWPGNVRQLKQGIERTMLVVDKPVLDAADFQMTSEMEPREAARDVLPPVGSMTMDELEKAMIVKSLKHHNGNISKVAQALGLSRAALYRRFEKYEIAV